MASRESQGLQIALILFVMVTVVLAVTTYFFFRKAEEKTKQAAAARVEAKNFDNAAKQLDFENQVLRHVIGLRTDDTLETAQLEVVKQSLGGNKYIEELLTSFDQDMAMYGAGLEGTLNYRKLPDHLIAQVNDRNVKLTDADLTIRNLQAAKDEAVDAEEKRTAKVQESLTLVQEDLAAQVRQFGVARNKLTEDKNKLAASIPQKNAAISKLEADMAAGFAQRDTELRSLAESNAMAREKLAEAMKPQEFERPDGQVVYVNQRADVVWIDLGMADGLKRQMTFSVYDQNQVGATNAVTKASIQVIAIKDAHSAEARILEHDLGNPIMSGDKIYSPTFRKGQKTRFALAGFLDIDGDGKSDQKKVKSIITTNGGEVDAELLEDGSIAGKITLDTRYLVRGEAPTDKTKQQLIDGWNAMLEESTRKGLEAMALDELLARMGYSDDSRVVNLQRGGPGGSGKTETFRKRTPRSAYP